MKTVVWTLLFSLLAQGFFQPAFAEPSVKPSDSVASQEETGNSSEEKSFQEKEGKNFAVRSQKASRFVFSDLPRHLGHDIKESFWGWGSLGFGLGIAATAILHSQDRKIQARFGPNHLFGSTGNKVFNHLGAPYTLAGVGFLTLGIGKGIHNEKLALTGEAMLESLFWSMVLTYGMKFAFDQERPDGSRRGFPSAHASGAFSTATVLQVMYGPKVGVPAYAVATLIALSRVDSYKHFPSDILMGMTLGSVIGYGTARFHHKLHQKHLSIGPVVGPNSYGIFVTHDF